MIRRDTIAILEGLSERCLDGDIEEMMIYSVLSAVLASVFGPKPGEDLRELLAHVQEFSKKKVQELDGRTAEELMEKYGKPATLKELRQTARKIMEDHLGGP